MALEPLGVKAVVADLNKFLSDLGKMQKAIAETAEAATASSGAATDASQGILAMGGAASSTASGGMTFLATAAAFAAVEIGTALVNAAQDAISTLGELLTTSLGVAGRFKDLTNAAILLGSRMGFSQSEIEGLIDDMKDLGIRTDIAALTIAQLARNNLDLSKATELARAAQNAAKITGRDSSETLNALIDGIVTYNTRLIKNAGIQTVLGRAVDETGKQMGSQARTAFALNQVLKAAEANTGLYEQSQKSAAGQAKSLNRVMVELQGAIGAPFQDAWLTVLTAVRGFVETLTDAISEGGALFPIMVQLGAIASIVADAFAALVQVATNAVEGFRFEVNEGLSATVNDALMWGVEIVAALADGIVKGASTFLVAAMKFVGSILQSWLAPSSPPRVAPAIDAWGADTLTEWLRGFTRADFGVLSGLERILQQTLGTADFGNVIGQVMGALGTGGGGGGDLFARITAQAGQFGAEIAELTRRQLALASATRDVARAQLELDAAQRRVTAAQGNVRGLVDEYNALLEAGADESVLETKLAEIQAAEQAAKQAEIQAREAAEAQKLAAARVDPLKEQAQLQELLVKQLLALTKAEDTAEQKRRGRRGAGRAKRPELDVEQLLPTPGDLSLNITDAIGMAIDNAKAAITAKFGELFAPLTTTLNESIIPALQELQTQFNIVAETIVAFWESNVRPFLEQTVTDIQTWVGEITMRAQPLINLLTLFFTVELTKFSTFWATWGNEIIGTTTIVFQILETLIRTSMELIRGGVLLFLDLITLNFDQFGLDIQEMSANMWGIIEDIWGIGLDDIKLAWDTAWGIITTAFATLQTTFEKTAQDIMAGLQREFLDKFNLFKANVGDKIREFIDFIKRLLGIASPSRVFEDVGSQMGAGLLMGWADALAEGLQIPPVSFPGGQQASPTMAAQSAPMMEAPPTVRPLAMSFGPIFINNDMDLAMFEARVQQAVVKAMG